MDSSDKKMCGIISKMCIGGLFIGIGIWEGTVASNYNNTISYLLKVYIFTIFKIILNISFGLSSCCLSCKSDDDDKPNKTNYLYIINFIINIFACIMYTHHTIDWFGPFYEVVYAEFIIFIIQCCIYVCILTCSCCILCKINSLNDNIQVPTTNIIQKQEEPVVITVTM